MYEEFRSGTSSFGDLAPAKHAFDKFHVEATCYARGTVFDLCFHVATIRTIVQCVFNSTRASALLPVSCLEADFRNLPNGTFGLSYNVTLFSGSSYKPL